MSGDGDGSSPRVTIPGYDRAKRKPLIEAGLIVPRPPAEAAAIAAGASPEPRFVFSMPYLPIDGAARAVHARDAGKPLAEHREWGSRRDDRPRFGKPRL